MVDISSHPRCFILAPRPGMQIPLISKTTLEACTSQVGASLYSPETLHMHADVGVASIGIDHHNKKWNTKHVHTESAISLVLLFYLDVFDASSSLASCLCSSSLFCFCLSSRRILLCFTFCLRASAWSLHTHTHTHTRKHNNIHVLYHKKLQ